MPLATDLVSGKLESIDRNGVLVYYIHVDFGQSRDSKRVGLL